MANSVYPLNGYKTAATAIVATRPSVVGDGVSVASFPYGTSRICIELDGDAAITLSDPTAGTLGVEVWAWDAAFSTGQWFLVGILNNGADILLVGAAQGWAEVLDLGRPYDRLCVSATESTGAATYTIVPLEVNDR